MSHTNNWNPKTINFLIVFYIDNCIAFFLTEILIKSGIVCLLLKSAFLSVQLIMVSTINDILNF